MSKRAALFGLGLLLSPASAQAQGPEPSAVRPIVIDAGHGGEDLGAVVGGVREKDIALAVARRLKAALEEDGAARAALVRDSDDYVPLDDRVARSLALEGSGFISLHVNKVDVKRLRGIAVYVFGNGASRFARRRPRARRLTPLPPPPRQALEASLRLANTLVDSLRAEGLETDTLCRSRYYVLKNPRLPSVLVELGYLSNPEEAALLQDPGYQDRLAKALARGMVEYEVRAGKSQKTVVMGR
ncbi:MAG: N-acetylmuramoyl-L-alanine amidase [Elusimicrobia bacterium]|nr:N-acetylmuramoyl-L-alanine amidase [Elusimicrobiota bacterium]